MTTKKFKCIKCKRYRASRKNRLCLSCYQKNRSGSKSNNYKDGRTLKIYKCQCGNVINMVQFLYGKGSKGRCSDCFHKSLKGKKVIFSSIHLKNLRKGLKKRNFYGRNNPNFGGKCHSKNNQYKGAKYQNIWMRSSWEIAYAKWLNHNNIKWKYECTTFDLGNTTYTPDFYLPDFDLYVEIKGYWQLDAKQKIKILKRKFPNIFLYVLDKQKLSKIGII